MKTSKPKNALPSSRKANIKLTNRIQRFCEFIAAGESQTDAWLKAGHKCTRAAARVNAARALTRANITARIAELRAPQSRLAALTRDRKREMLCRIAENTLLPVEVRIRAMAEDSKMAGHYEPEHHVVDMGDKTIQSIRERAMKVSSALSAVPRRQAATL